MSEIDPVTIYQEIERNNQLVSAAQTNKGENIVAMGNRATLIP